MTALPTELCRYHANANFFREAVNSTAIETGFGSKLVEKDYFCSLVLAFLFQDEASTLVFKGGTALNKVHTDFYRLSEDLDFVIPLPSSAHRPERSRAAEPYKKIMERLANEVSGIRLEVPLRGHNVSKQYIGYVSYVSHVTGGPERIKVEIGLREDTLRPVERKSVKTLLVDPIKENEVFPAFPAPVMSFEEAYAEKFRAAMTRRTPAIRDFYDVFHAVTSMGFDPLRNDFIDLIVVKLQVPGNDAIDLSPLRKAALESQLHTELEAVLRKKDFERFDIDKAFEIVRSVAEKVGSV